MAGIGTSLSRLRTLYELFEKRLRAGSGKSAQRPARPSRLQELTNFGSNPGNLRMHVYVPNGVDGSPALVVALHGCTQTADSYDQGTGWSDLADRLGFTLIFPEQQPANNPKNCFSWFLPGDTTRDGGEALSIRQMIAKGVAEFGVDRSRIFVSGLSAGGAMASVMLATYPEIFAGGAIIAGLPYGAASSVQEAFEAMFNERAPSSCAQDRAIAAPGQRFRCGMGWPTPSCGRQTRITLSGNGSMCRSCPNVRQGMNELGGMPAASGRMQTAARGSKPTASPGWLMVCRLPRRVWMDAGLPVRFFWKRGFPLPS
jgi:poly(hydroxyalkanoate) depolymerase family esterase